MGEEHFRRRMMPSAPCAGTVEVPTVREQDALRELRTIKLRVRELKQATQETGMLSVQRRVAIEEELQHLKQEWNRWEIERKEAARERMLLLGHEEA